MLRKHRLAGVEGVDFRGITAMLSKYVCNDQPMSESQTRALSPFC